MGYLAFAPLVFVAEKARPSALLVYGLSWLAWLAPNYRQSPGLSQSTITHDEEWASRLRVDRAARVITSAAQMNDMLARGRRLADPAFVKGFVNKNLLVIHSSIDEVTDFDGSKKFFDAFIQTHENDNGNIRRFIEYDHMHHCMMYETKDRQYEMYRDTTKFLDDVLA